MDLISREAAIEAITNYAKFLWKNYHETCNLAGMIDAIDALPAAEPRWIPVTERLPDISGSYLATVYSGKHSPFVNVDYFFKSTGEWDYYRVDVIAWAEMPEPWRGEEG